MSRIGKHPVTIPAGVTLTLDGQKVTVKGPKGELNFTLPGVIAGKLEGAEFSVKPIDESNEGRAMWGMSRSMVANLIEGVTNGYQKNLELRGVGYRAKANGSSITLQLGYSHEINYTAPEGISLATPIATTVHVTGIDKQQVGQVAAEIRSFRKPEPYKGKGVRYEGEYVRSKEGKKK
jgi:large subunit ribosomal protein L6